MRLDEDPAEEDWDREPVRTGNMGGEKQMDEERETEIRNGWARRLGCGETTTGMETREGEARTGLARRLGLG